jgi:hypothetical protein
MCPCVRLSYRSVNYQYREREPIWRQPERPYQLVSGRLFHFPRGGVDVTEGQSVAQVGGEHVEVQILMKTEKDHFGPVSRKKEHMLEIYLGDPDDSLKRLVNALRRYHESGDRPPTCPGSRSTSRGILS